MTSMLVKRIGRSALRWAWRPREGRRAPQYRGSGLVGDYLAFRRNPLAVLEDVARTCGDVGWIRISHTEIYLFNDPAAVRAILLEKNDVFDRGDGSPDALLPYIGRGVLTTSGDAWRDERRAMNEGVYDDMEARLVEAAAAVTCRRVAAVAARRSGAQIDVARWTMALTTQVSLTTFFGYAIGDDDAAQFVDDFIEAQSAIFKNFIEGIPGSRYFPLPHNLRLAACTRRMWALAERVVAHAERDRHADNVLARVLRAPEGAAAGCPVHALLGATVAGRRRRAVEYVMGFLVAAPENPSNALTWGLYLLSQHREALARLRAEVDDVLPRGAAPSLADLGRLKYTRQVIQEILRLYPGAWCFDREATREDVVVGYAVPRGAMLAISPYLLHRNPRYWEQPDRFSPERFGAGRKLPVKGSYLPFGAGPRQCVGTRYAQMQLQLMLPLLVRDLDFDRGGHHPPEPHPMFTLRVRGSLPMRLAPRAAAPLPRGSPTSAGRGATCSAQGAHAGALQALPRPVGGVQPG